MSVGVYDAVGEISTYRGTSEPKEEEHEEELVQAWDDVSGQALDAREVKKARRVELEHANRKKVWEKTTREEARRRGWRIIKTRWIDINKGDDRNPNYRSRLVGKEFNDGEVVALFAATPPLEALRVLVSEAATVEKGGRKVMVINDVSRAFIEAPVKRNICVELPEKQLTRRGVDEE